MCISSSSPSPPLNLYYKEGLDPVVNPALGQSCLRQPTTFLLYVFQLKIGSFSTCCCCCYCCCYCCCIFDIWGRVVWKSYPCIKALTAAIGFTYCIPSTTTFQICEQVPGHGGCEHWTAPLDVPCKTQSNIRCRVELLFNHVYDHPIQDCKPQFHPCSVSTTLSNQLN